MDSLFLCLGIVSQHGDNDVAKYIISLKCYHTYANSWEVIHKNSLISEVDSDMFYDSQSPRDSLHQINELKQLFV